MQNNTALRMTTLFTRLSALLAVLVAVLPVVGYGLFLQGRASNQLAPQTGISIEAELWIALCVFCASLMFAALIWGRLRKLPLAALAEAD